MDIRWTPNIPGKSSEHFPFTKENAVLEVLHIFGDA
jgi:hypothetical protein